MVKVKEVIEQAAENISHMKPGTIVLRDALEALLGITNIDWEEDKYRSRVQRLIECLEKEYHIFLKCDNGNGYKILQPGDEIELISDKFNKATKRVVKVQQKIPMINIGAIKDPVKRDRTIHEAQRIMMTQLLYPKGVYLTKENLISENASRDNKQQKAI